MQRVFTQWRIVYPGFCNDARVDGRQATNWFFSTFSFHFCDLTTYVTNKNQDPLLLQRERTVYWSDGATISYTVLRTIVFRRTQSLWTKPIRIRMHCRPNKKAFHKAEREGDAAISTCNTHKIIMVSTHCDSCKKSSHSTLRFREKIFKRNLLKYLWKIVYF